MRSAGGMPPPAASPAAAAGPTSPRGGGGNQHNKNKRRREDEDAATVTPPPPRRAAPRLPPPTTAVEALPSLARGAEDLAELMMAVPAPRIELPPGLEALSSDAEAARLCQSLLGKAQDFKHSGDAALRDRAGGEKDKASADPFPSWDGRALERYVCAAVTYIESAELVQQLAQVAWAGGGGGAAAAAAQQQQPQPHSGASPSPSPRLASMGGAPDRPAATPPLPRLSHDGGGTSSQQQQQQKQRGEVARLAAQLRPQLMAQTARLCHAAAAGARRRLEEEEQEGGEHNEAANRRRAQFALYAALCERLAAVCHLRHVAAQAIVLPEDVRLCGAAGTGGSGGAATTPPASSSGGGPLSSQHRLADAASHIMRALDLMARSTAALRERAAHARSPLCACAFAPGAVAHIAHVAVDAGMPASDVFRLAARARAALGCIQQMGR
jgi:hypothetical protein